MRTILAVFRAFTAVLAVCFACGRSGSQTTSNSALLLRVVNRHFTVGKRIPSDFLKVFSDGRVECHAVKFDKHDEHVVKATKLSQLDLEKVIATLKDRRIQHLSHDYKLHRFVVDSWMEWDITIEQTSHRQSVVLAFAGGSDQTALPEEMEKIGCLILELRRTAYGDDTSYYAPVCAVR